IRIGPVSPAQVVQSDDKPQTLRDRRDHQDRHRTEEERSLYPCVGAKAEVDGSDRDGDGNPIPDDPEPPCVAGISLIDESAFRAPIPTRQPTLAPGSAPTVGACLPQPVLERDPGMDAFR